MLTAYADVDVQRVASEVAQGCLFHSGQMCVATKRVYVHKNIYTSFLDSLIKEFRSFRTATTREDMSIFGPIQNDMQHKIVEDLVADCKAKGYKIATGGAALDYSGLWIEPTIIDRPPDDALIVQGEQFGE